MKNFSRRDFIQLSGAGIAATAFREIGRRRAQKA
ncbi:twin-arginine translocation signal domain-containing protein [Thalassotalea psychrophila]|uniref:Twin-arginine translocation signal domain-containing protein n=1 Tax=Thalassotalea psychrophila TaxID=3065647 RepID=A0ABY9TVP7_9GAMM|nr:twin-arginine translocation signal domain-containing protein [Colwelliaceae bacterium SQ149]